MAIHFTDPFADPEPERSPVRRLRGRLPAPVTLWTAPGPAGLTVSSLLVAEGEPGRVLGLLDEESAVYPALLAAGRFVVCLLAPGEQAVADRFAGLAPAPGGWFTQDQWRETGYGPVLAGDRTWAGCVVAGARRCGWAILVEGEIADLTIGADAGGAVVHHRGRYGRIDG